jgi:hypothetical protein
MPLLTPLDGNQIRQLIDAEQVYEAYRAAVAERHQRFRGSLSWKRVSGREYLYRKVGESWKSLGPRTPETSLAHDRFHAGRAAGDERIRELDARIKELARVNRALRLGRVPLTAARVLRRLDRQGLLGSAVSVVGTHALFAYERLAGAHFHPSQVTTADIDLLFDARDRLALAAPAVREEGLAGLLRAVDDSFRPLAPGSFRAANRAGFMVDLITPMPAAPSQAAAKQIGSGAEELTAAEIDGLSWLQNSPQLSQIVLDERGYPLTLQVPDPRAFALHKIWVSERPDRDRAKARRDRAQAEAIAALVIHHLPQYSFDDPRLSSLPQALRRRAAELVASAEKLYPEEPW